MCCNTSRRSRRLSCCIILVSEPGCADLLLSTSVDLFPSHSAFLASFEIHSIHIFALFTYPLHQDSTRLRSIWSGWFARAASRVSPQRMSSRTGIVMSIPLPWNLPVEIATVLGPSRFRWGRTSTDPLPGPVEDPLRV